jgi:diaminopimelate epimerase
MKFTKMHGIGNDYIYVDCLKETLENPEAVARFVSDRHFGIGSDGLVLLLPAQSGAADFRMRMFNADGSEAEMCGNAIRCVGKLLFDKGISAKNPVRVETKAGVKTLWLTVENGSVRLARVDMGAPVLEPAQIPVAAASNKIQIEVGGKDYDVTCVSMGNPHAVMYMEDIDALEIEKIGPLFENHPVFPKRTNTEFVRVVDRNTLQMRVWERGAGETLACGTGACAALAASVLNGLCERKAALKLRGGDLFIEWSAEDNRVYMTGPATTVFEGEIDV